MIDCDVALGAINPGTARDCRDVSIIGTIGLDITLVGDVRCSELSAVTPGVRIRTETDIGPSPGAGLHALIGWREISCLVEF
jgi:hypothetical protein